MRKSRFTGEQIAMALRQAEALRRAQMRRLEGYTFAHPLCWSSFLVISNWL
jgi:CHAT domain-containing protein